MQPGTDFAKMEEKSPNLEMSNKDRRQNVFDHLKQFWTRQDAHRWGEDYDLNNSPQEFALDNAFDENDDSNLVVKYKHAIEFYLNVIRGPILNAQPPDAEGRPKTPPLLGRVASERDQIQEVLNYWSANNNNDPKQFRDIAEYDEFVALNEKRNRYHHEWEKWGGERGRNFAKSMHDRYRDFRQGRNREWSGRGKGADKTGYKKRKDAFFDVGNPLPDDVSKSIWKYQFSELNDLMQTQKKDTLLALQKKYLDLQRDRNNNNIWIEGKTGREFMVYVEKFFNLWFNKNYDALKKDLAFNKPKLIVKKFEIEPDDFLLKSNTFRLQPALFKKKIQKPYSMLKKSFDKIVKEEEEKVMKKFPQNEHDTIRNFFEHTKTKLYHSPLFGDNPSAVELFYQQSRIFSKKLKTKYFKLQLKFTKDQLLDQAVDGLGNDALEEKTETIIQMLKVALIDWVDENYKQKISKLQSIKDETIEAFFDKAFYNHFGPKVSFNDILPSITKYLDDLKTFIFLEIELPKKFPKEVINKLWRQLEKHTKYSFFDPDIVGSGFLFPKPQYSTNPVIKKSWEQKIMEQNKDNLKNMVGSGLMDWLKNKYNNTFAKPTTLKTDDVIQPANQSLPPEIPSTNILQQVASNAYKESPAPVASFNLLHQTPTVKFYQSSLNAKLYVFGIRGTVVSDKQDRSADLSFNEGIVGNNLKKSARYKKDKVDVADFLTRYNVDDSDFIVGAAHSLGGALCDELLHDGLIDYAVSFNPAVQPKDVNFTQFHRRIYLDKDPLYQTMARNNVKNNIEVRQTKQTTGSNILGAVSKNLGTLWQTKGAHSIDNFVGGKKQVERYYDEDANVWKGGSCMCPRNYQPVVGEDGKTYNNKCQAMCAKRKFDEAENRWVGGTQYFSIDNPETNELMYAAELQPQQCKFQINNRRCKRKQNIGVEYCFQHLPAFMKLKIQPTNDGRGKGVFAYGGKLANEDTVVFQNNAIIAKYNGDKIDQEELDKRYGGFTGPYATEAERRRNPTKFIDAATIRGVGSMINANNSDDDEEPNCALKFVEDKKKRSVKDWNEVNPRDTLEKENDVIIVATKNIQHGAQLLLRYGDRYEFENNHTTGTKKPKETHGKNIKNGYYQELEDE